MELLINNLSKTYDNGVKALDGVSLQIPTGMYGLLGPNGAGKSSLMRTIATLQDADAGSIILDDINVQENKQSIRKLLGYLPQQFGVYPKISAEVLLNHLAVLKGLTNKSNRKEVVEALLHKTNLFDVRKQNLGGYSGGMKQRFGIAQALLNNPKLLIVDEPTAGLDPKERNRFYNLLSDIAENTIVILSTHIVEDVKELCTKMAIINKGRVISQGNPLQLIDDLNGKVFQKTVDRADLKTLRRQHKVINETLYLGQPVVQIVSEEAPNNGFTAVEAGLEDVYFSQINQ